MSDFLQGSFPLLFSALWLLLIVGFVFIVVAVSTGLFNEFLQGSFPLLLTALSLLLLLVVEVGFIVVAVSTGLFNDFLQALLEGQFSRENQRGRNPPNIPHQEC